MQRRPTPHPPNGSSSSHSSGSRPTLERTNSKSKRKRGPAILIFSIVLPIMFGSAILYSTRRAGDSTRAIRTTSAKRASKQQAVPGAGAGAEIFTDTVGTTSGGVEYYIVFSTGCSLYQDWQSYVFFFQAMSANQPGTVTRIVSGCDEEDEKKMTEQFEKEIHPMAPGRFKIHFTPDYSKLPNGKSFVYWSTLPVAPLDEG